MWARKSVRSWLALYLEFSADMVFWMPGAGCSGHRKAFPSRIPVAGILAQPQAPGRRSKQAVASGEQRRASDVPFAQRMGTHFFFQAGFISCAVNDSMVNEPPWALSEMPPNGLPMSLRALVL